MTIVLVAVGAAVGAPLRYVVDRLIQRRHNSVFPWGTLLVNVVGSFILGLLLSAAADGQVSDELVYLVGTGFCGALTTYSTMSYETLRLFDDGAWGYALTNVAVSLVAGVGAASLGWWIG